MAGKKQSAGATGPEDDDEEGDDEGRVGEARRKTKVQGLRSKAML